MSPLLVLPLSLPIARVCRLILGVKNDNRGSICTFTLLLVAGLVGSATRPLPFSITYANKKAQLDIQGKTRS
jgi:hypothetical protein